MGFATSVAYLTLGSLTKPSVKNILSPLYNDLLISGFFLLAGVAMLRWCVIIKS